MMNDSGKILLLSMMKTAFIFIAILALAVILFSQTGCAIFEVTQTHYKRELPGLPQKEQISLEDVGAVAVGGTEINKGLMELNTLFTLAEDIEPAKFISKIKKFEPRMKILVDFSYNVMGFLGVAWDKIDWNDPEKFFAQADEKQKEMQEALKNEKDRNLKLEKDVADFTTKLAEKEKAVKSKEEELVANDGKWSVKLSWWVGLIKWIVILFLLVGLCIYGYQVFLKYTAGLPLKVAMFGGKTAAKGLTQIVKGIQEARLKIHAKKENGATPEKEKKALEDAMDILSRELSTAGNEEVHKLVSSIKDKHKVKNLTP